MQKIILYLIKKLFSSSGNALIGITLASVILGLGGIRIFYEKLWIYIKSTMLSPTPLYLTIVLVLALGVYIYCIYQKVTKVQTFNTPLQETFTKRFGILWDENYQPHCGTHKNLLQSYRAYGTSDPAITRWGFICPSCKNPIFIVDQNGKYITQEDAIEKLKNL